MEGLLEEILEIPERAKECYERNKHAALPRRVPYLGMGSSYFAPLALYYAGARLDPESQRSEKQALERLYGSADLLIENLTDVFAPLMAAR